MPKTVVRSAYGIFFAFPDTNLINNTVVTVPFVRQLAIVQRPAARRAHPHLLELLPGRADRVAQSQSRPALFVRAGAEFLRHAEYDVGAGESSRAVYPAVEPHGAARRSRRGSPSRRRTSAAGRCGLQQGQRRNDPPPGPGAIQARRPLPQWGAIGLQEWGGKGTYNALQTSLEVRDWHGLTLMGSYVRAKCLDNGTDDSGAPSMALIGLNYAPCDFDQTNTSSVSFNYGMPVGRGKRFLNHLPGAADRVLGGWELAAVTTLKSGLPFTPTIGSDRANTGAGRTAAERDRPGVCSADDQLLVLHFRQFELPLAVPERDGQFLCPGAIHDRNRRQEHSARGQSGAARFVDSEGRHDQRVEAGCSSGRSFSIY